MFNGERLKALRIEHGYSQEKLAEVLDLSVSSVYRWETNNSLDSFEIAKNLADLYGMELKDFLLNVAPSETAEYLRQSTSFRAEITITKQTEESKPAEKIQTKINSPIRKLIKAEFIVILSVTVIFALIFCCLRLFWYPAKMKEENTSVLIDFPFAEIFLVYGTILTFGVLLTLSIYFIIKVTKRKRR